MAKESKDRQRYWSIAKTANRRAARYGLPGRLRRPDIRRVLSTYQRCLKCGATERLTVDHIKPMFRGGPNDTGNLQILCFKCNLKKGLKTADYRP